MYTADIGGLPILEKKLWTPYCGDPPNAGGTCANPSFDPFNPTNQSDLDNALGIAIGSGPWTCIVPNVGTNPNAGHIGGPCGETSISALTGQAMTLGDRFMLQQNPLFIRCCPTGSGATTSSLYKLSWVDRYNSETINLFDLASADQAQGTADQYWCNTNIPSACINGKVTVFPLAYADNYQYLGDRSLQS
jgi:hypothetical protein